MCETRKYRDRYRNIGHQYRYRSIFQYRAALLGGHYNKTKLQF